MSLSVGDCKVGTIVDHRWAIDPTKRGHAKTSLRDMCRRGIVMSVDGAGTDSVSNLMVLFKVGGKPAPVPPAELDRVFPASHRQAREAYRRITGAPKNVGATFVQKKTVARQRVVDELALTGSRKEGPVLPSAEETEESDRIVGMDLEDSGA